MAQLSLFRTPDTFVPLNAVSTASSSAVFTPNSGGYPAGKFRLLGFDLYGSVAGLYQFIDGNTGTTLYSTWLDGTTGKGVAIGMIGCLSTQKNSPLKILGPSASAVSGSLMVCVEAESVTL